MSVHATDILIDGTLFKSEYNQAQGQYRVSSHTPVEGFPKPIILVTHITRGDATKFRDSNWVNGHSIDTAALALGVKTLQEQIPGAIRKLREGELVQDELEQLEGFGAF